jgi:glycerol-3-phosphate dehydrogenase (NAD(P)+)
MKIAVLGLGVWGFCLARHLALQGHQIVGWTKEEDIAMILRRGDDHPHLHRSCRGLPLTISSSIGEAIEGVDLIVESVSTGGLRTVLQEILRLKGSLPAPLVLTSKGIEQKTFLTTPDLVVDVFSPTCKSLVCMLSGPSFAVEVASHLPTAVVCGAWDLKTAEKVIAAFTSSTFRVYPNADIRGVAIGGALKNIIAIACGIADGLGLGMGARASLVTRGLHEMVKLAVADGSLVQTLYGLSGLGDLYLTCSSSLSRNFRFGQLISTGLSRAAAEKQIGMAVEGAYTCRAAKDLAEKLHVPMPITELVWGIMEGELLPSDAVERLMQRMVKEEHL